MNDAHDENDAMDDETFDDYSIPAQQRFRQPARLPERDPRTVSPCRIPRAGPVRSDGKQLYYYSTENHVHYLTNYTCNNYSAYLFWTAS